MGSFALMNKKYVVYVRSMLTLSLLLVGAYNYDIVAERFDAAAVYTLALIVSNMAVMMMPKRMFKGVKAHYFIFVMDIALIIIGCHILTTLDMPFLIAVFLAVFMAALSQSVRMSVLIAVVVNAVYVYTKTYAAGESMDEASLLNIPFVFVVALHGSLMAERAAEEERSALELEKINEKLSRKVSDKTKAYTGLLEFTGDLSESFADALVVFDIDGSVKIFNSAASELFGISKEDAIGRPIKELPMLSGAKDMIMALKFEGKQSRDGLVELRKNEGVTRIRATVSYIKNSDDDETGILFYARRI